MGSLGGKIVIIKHHWKSWNEANPKDNILGLGETYPTYSMYTKLGDNQIQKNTTFITIIKFWRKVFILL